jgi:hypothetical protein
MSGTPKYNKPFFIDRSTVNYFAGKEVDLAQVFLFIYAFIYSFFDVLII